MFVSTILSRYFNKKKKKKLLIMTRNSLWKSGNKIKKLLVYIFALHETLKVKNKMSRPIFYFYRIISWYSRLSHFSKWPLNQHTTAPMFRASDAAWGLDPSSVLPSSLSPIAVLNNTNGHGYSIYTTSSVLPSLPRLSYPRIKIWV